MTTTKDEALKRAHESGLRSADSAHFDYACGPKDHITTVCEAYIHAYNSSLRESGWTLAPVEATPWQIERAAKAMYQSKKWGDPKEGPGENMKNVWRNYARLALAAAQEDKSNG